MPSERPEHRLSAILSGDVAGYTRLIAADEDAAVRRLAVYREEVELLLRQHQGRLVDFAGDNFLAEFASTVKAVACSIEIQDVLGARNARLAAAERMDFRIGIHLGEVRAEGERIYGDGVNIAARLEALAEPGGVCISQPVRDQIESRLHLETRDLGEQTLKNVPRPVRAFRLDGRSTRGPKSHGPDADRMRGRRTWYIPGVVLAASITALFALLFHVLDRRSERVSPATEYGDIDSVAVLPLDNLMNDPDQDYFVAGMTEALIAELARAGSLKVISRTSAMQYVDTDKGLPEIASDLGVDAVVEGSVLRGGDRVRITAQLIHGRRDEHLWSGSYERPLADILKLQREVAGAIAREIRGTLTTQQNKRLASASTIDPAAHEAYLRGRYYWNRRTAADLELAREYFRQAIALEPAFAAAHAGLADTYLMLGTYGTLAATKSAELARTSALRALEIDPDSAEGQTALGYVRFASDWDWEGAERALSRAIELNPYDAASRHWYGTVLMATGRFDEARSEVTRAVELDPLSPIVGTAVGLVETFAGRYDEAAAAYLKVLRRVPGFAPAAEGLAIVYQLQGRVEEAIEELEKLVSTGATAAQRADLAASYALAGRRNDARELLDELGPPPVNALLSVARARYLLGETDEAMRVLEEAYERRTTILVSLGHAPQLDPMRDDARFQAILRRMGFPD